MLEFSAFVLVVAQLFLSWLALDRLPSTVIPYFGLGGGSIGLPAAAAEARLWVWMVVGLWAMLITASVLMYRAIQTTPIPIVSVSALAFLAVLRAGAISLNLNPVASPKQVLLRAILVGVVAFLLGVAVERFRSRKQLPPLLIGKALYDERAPRGLAYYAIMGLGLGVPALFVPVRARVIDSGVLVITAVSHFSIPRVSIERIERATPLQSLFGAGVNFAASPTQAVRIFRRGRLFPVVFSVAKRDRFIEAVESTVSD